MEFLTFLGIARHTARPYSTGAGDSFLGAGGTSAAQLLPSAWSSVSSSGCLPSPLPAWHHKQPLWAGAAGGRQPELEPELHVLSRSCQTEALHPPRAVRCSAAGAVVATAATAGGEGGKTACLALDSPQLVTWLQPLGVAQGREYSGSCGGWLPGSGPTNASEPSGQPANQPAPTCVAGPLSASCSSMTAPLGMGVGSWEPSGPHSPHGLSPSCRLLGGVQPLRPSPGWPLCICSAAPAGQPSSAPADGKAGR